MTTERRRILVGLLTSAAAGLGPRSALSQAGSLFPFEDDRGRQVYNYRLPSDLSVEGLPGVLWTGARTPEVILVEFFDYNCPYCRAAANDLDALLRTVPTLRLGLVNNAVLSPGSVQAAKIQQAVLRSSGPDTAYRFHRRLYETRGTIDGPMALAALSELGLDAKAIESAADLPQIGEVVRRQRKLAEALGFAATPSFMLGSIGLLGYPGPAALARAVAAFRHCDKLVCP